MTEIKYDCGSVNVSDTIRKKGQEYDLGIYLVHKLSLYPINDITITNKICMGHI